MSSGNGRLSVALDVQSVMDLGGWGHKTKWNGPRSNPVASTTGTGAGPTHNCDEGADVAKSTRGYPRSDSETRDSTVKITPVSIVSATVPTTRTVA